MGTAADRIQNFIKICASVFLALMIVIVLLQVVSRWAIFTYFLPFNPVWTEEASRFMMVFMANFAGIAAMSVSGFIKVDLLLDYLPEKVSLVLEILGELLVCALLLALLLPSYEIVMARLAQSSPNLGISMAIPQSAVLIGNAGILAAGICKIVARIRFFKKQKGVA